MPKVTGVHKDRKGRYYFKAATGYDPTTGTYGQVTRRGFTSAAEAAKARAAFLAERSAPPPSPVALLTVAELVERYLEECEASNRLGPKTLFDYRHYLEDYIRPWIGDLAVGDVDAEVIAAWQHTLAERGATKSGRGLGPNSIRLARAPLNGAFKHATARGQLPANPLALVARPRLPRRKPQHWTPEQARHFLALHEDDRLQPLWAFLLSSGLRIGELVWLRWANVDLDHGLVRINEFATSLGYELHASEGKSTDAVRTIDIDDLLIGVLRNQRRTQVTEQLACLDYVESDYVFTTPSGGSYHPQYLSKLLATTSTELGLPRLTAHGLRHTCATLMLDQQVPAKVAAERLGHADPTLFIKLYSHVTPSMQQQAAARLGATLLGDSC